MSTIERFLQNKGALIVNGGERGWFAGIANEESWCQADSYYIDMSLDEGTWAASVEEAIRLTEEAAQAHALAMEGMKRYREYYP